MSQKEKRTRSRKLLIILVTISIISSGIFKTQIIAGLGNLFDISQYEGLMNALNQIYLGDNKRGDLLGWILFYPFYLSLHLSLIFLLFSGHRKLRNILVLILLSLVLCLVLIILISKLMDWESVYTSAYLIFRRLFSLPIILFFIEGGRSIYETIITRYDESQKLDQQ